MTRPDLAAKLVLALLSLAASGCGLLWNFEPPRAEPDAGRMDAGVRDAGSRDAGSPDAGSADAGSTDAGGLDAGSDGGVTRPDGDVTQPDGDVIPADSGLDATVSNLECEDTCGDPNYCDRPEGRCIGPATCVPIPLAPCPDVIARVCGCDRNTYQNECEARSAGTSILREGPCPDFEQYDWCNPGPNLPPNPSGCVRCYDDADCSTFFPLCIGSACGTGGDGICAANGGPSTCYYDYHCAPGRRCVGALVHGCRDDARLPTQGRCE